MWYQPLLDQKNHASRAQICVVELLQCQIESLKTMSDSSSYATVQVHIDRWVLYVPTSKICTVKGMLLK